MHDYRISQANDYMVQLLKCASEHPHWYWQQLGTGTSNQLLTTVICNQRWVLRLNADQAVVPGCDRTREAWVLALVNDHRWSPQVVFNQPQQGWCLMKYCGEKLTKPLHRRQSLQLVDSLSQLHQLNVNCAEVDIDYSALFEYYRPLVQSLPVADQLNRLLDQVPNQLDVLYNLPATLVHHDLHLGNLCWDGVQLRIIDWEYAGQGILWFDLAALKHKLNVPMAQLSALPAIKGITASTVALSITRAQHLSSLLECLWYWARGLAGTEKTMQQLVMETLQLSRN